MDSLINILGKVSIGTSNLYMVDFIVVVQLCIKMMLKMILSKYSNLYKFRLQLLEFGVNKHQCVKPGNGKVNARFFPILPASNQKRIATGKFLLYSAVLRWNINHSFLVWITAWI